MLPSTRFQRVQNPNNLHNASKSCSRQITSTKITLSRDLTIRRWERKLTKMRAIVGQYSGYRVDIINLLPLLSLTHGEKMTYPRRCSKCFFPALPGEYETWSVNYWKFEWNWKLIRCRSFPGNTQGDAANDLFFLTNLAYMLVSILCSLRNFKSGADCWSCHSWFAKYKFWNTGNYSGVSGCGVDGVGNLCTCSRVGAEFGCRVLSVQCYLVKKNCTSHWEHDFTYHM